MDRVRRSDPNKTNMKPQFEAIATEMRARNVPQSRTGIRKRKERIQLVLDSKVKNLTTSEVARISGASLRQLQWWDEKGIVQVRIDGHDRVYTPEDTGKVVGIMKLRKKGVKLRKALKIATYSAFAVDSICEALDLLKRYNLKLR